MNDPSQHIPVAAPIDTDSAGKGGDKAMQSVLRVICHQQNSSGTGFLHQSGKIITAEHVVRGCKDPLLILPTGVQIKTSVIVVVDNNHDLAILEPETPISADSLVISGATSLAVGTQVSTWGFPGGYTGLSSMLSIGYLAGVDSHKTKSGQIIQQWVVNAAFNVGNSGGPLLLIETGEVIGVVSSKIAPISQESKTILKALEN